MLRLIRRFAVDEEGLTVVEYVVSAALLAIILIGVFTALETGMIREFAAAFS
ncbi:hypothetical protein P4S72_19790 [Vibrio sp. PP-XX7]